MVTNPNYICSLCLFKAASYSNLFNDFVNPCNSTYCKNNATCVFNQETKQAICVCPAGFGGQDCKQGKYYDQTIIKNSII
jgi:hypothetical protein